MYPGTVVRNLRQYLKLKGASKIVYALHELAMILISLVEANRINITLQSLDTCASKIFFPPNEFCPFSA